MLVEVVTAFILAVIFTVYCIGEDERILQDGKRYRLGANGRYQTVNRDARWFRGVALLFLVSFAVFTPLVVLLSWPGTYWVE